MAWMIVVYPFLKTEIDGLKSQIFYLPLQISFAKVSCFYEIIQQEGHPDSSTSQFGRHHRFF
jgi:hypothetical protein